MPNGIKVYPADLALDVEVQTKIVTDKDFRPQRNKDLLSFLQVATSIRNVDPRLGQVDLRPFVEEFARGVGMNPTKVWSQLPMIPGVTMPGQAPTAMDRVGQAAAQAQGVRGMAGELGQAAHASAQQQFSAAI